MKRRFTTVAVVMGGPGSEREVSLRSGQAIAEGLREGGYDVVELDVRNMTFELPESVEAVFPIIHGSMGEDGILQRRLEELGVPYVGSRSWEMPKSFDKEITHALSAVVDIPMADWEVVTSGSACGIDLPVVLKAPREGSSIGIEIVHSPDHLADAFERVRKYDERILVEKFTAGRECTVGILRDRALPVVEIRPEEGMYDYEAKYSRTDTQYLCPAPLTDEQTSWLQETALRAFRQLGGRHLGRLDFIVPDEGNPVLLELNPLPGFTGTSLLPKAASASGLDFSSLCVQIMEMAE